MANIKIPTNFPLHIFIFEARASLQTFRQSLKQKDSKSAQVGNVPKQPSFAVDLSITYSMPLQSMKFVACLFRAPLGISRLHCYVSILGLQKVELDIWGNLLISRPFYCINKDYDATHIVIKFSRSVLPLYRPGLDTKNISKEATEAILKLVQVFCPFYRFNQN